MKVLSIRQPWAYLVVEGIKDVENRSWTSSHRGELLIHAGQRFDHAGLHWVRKQFPELDLSLDPDDYHCGGLIGQVDILDIVQNDPSPWADKGYYHWKIGGAERLPFMQCKGQLRLFEEPTCRVCGCTSYHACPGGCNWIEPDLCSSCGPGKEFDEFDMMFFDTGEEE